MADILRPRRYYLHQRIEAMLCGETALAGAWRWKQEQQPGTALLTDFPYRTRLAEVGYTTVQDIDGADECELGKLGFSSRQAAEILSAVAAL